MSPPIIAQCEAKGCPYVTKDTRYCPMHHRERINNHLPRRDRT